jgi:hypothetical protein
MDQFAACWEGLEDPRTGNAGLHDFHELLMIALCTVLCGGQGAVHMALFAKAKEPFLRGFLKLERAWSLSLARPARRPPEPSRARR